MVAPRFEAARSFILFGISKDVIKSKETIRCPGPEGYRRVRMLQIHRVSLLICNGIKGSHIDMLVASGISVLSGISGNIDDVFRRYLEGNLEYDKCQTPDISAPGDISHEELAVQARAIFKQHGYVTHPGPGDDSFLIDFVAELTCPVCGRPVRVAVCCGAHTYRTDIEIAEFHRATLSGYNARVYICPERANISAICRQYGIELIDPGQVKEQSDIMESDKIPLLRGLIGGHERASQSTPET
jgi:predicted Fe-Mo cluster-binding NifX family protein